MEANDSNCKACEKKNKNSLAEKDIASFAGSNNLPGALTAAFGLAVDPVTAGKVGTRLGNKPPDQLMKFIDTPGSNKQKKSMSSNQKKKHIINSVGLGNFSLNSTFENGLINSISGARNSSSDFLKNSKTGSSLMAASALGIDVPGGDMLGVGPGDSPMFKIFKLASFGLKLLCASLRGKQRGGPGGYTSDTEELLGALLSLGIDLGLLDRLKSIFDKILGLKDNFSSFGTKDLNIANSLFDLCDWVENMEYGSTTLDTLRKNLPTGKSNKTLTELAGKKLINDGTYDTYARNDFPFDQQFKSIAGDIDALKCDACRLGTTDITLSNQGKDLFNLEFDPRTGLQRDRGTPAPVKKVTKIVPKDIEYSESTGGIDYVTKKPEEQSTEELLAHSNKLLAKADADHKKLQELSAKLQKEEKDYYEGPDATPSEKAAYQAQLWSRPISDAEAKEEIKKFSEEERNALRKRGSEGEYGECKKMLYAKIKIIKRRHKARFSRLPTNQQLKDVLGSEHRACKESVDAAKKKKPPEVADNLTQPVAAGTDTLQVKDPSQFPEGSYSVLGYGTSNAECVCVDGHGSLKLKNPLQNNHPTGTTLSPAAAMCELETSSELDDIEEILNKETPSQKLVSTHVEDSINRANDPTIQTLTKDPSRQKSVSEHLGSTVDSSNVEYVTDADGTVYDSGNIVKDTYQNDKGEIITDTYESDDKGKHHLIKSEVVSKKPYGGSPAGPDDTSVKSFHTGETIKKEDLAGTVLEDADLNKVALLTPPDLKNLKNKEEVENTLADAEQKYDETFETEIEKTENLVLEEQSDGIVFGVQLPTILNGNQIVINSERVLISAKTQEMGLFSKRKFFVTTDDEITMNCKQRFVVKTDQHASIEAPTVHLGTYTTRNHPSLKGDCVKWWLDDLCDWLSSHVHNDPYVTTSTPVQQGSLAALKARTPTLLSERIFISG